MEGIDLAGVVDSDFQGIQINFAPPRPAGFANFRGAGRGGAGRTSPGWMMMMEKILQKFQKFSLSVKQIRFAMK